MSLTLLINFDLQLLKEMSDPMEEQSTEGGEALGSTAGNMNKGKHKEYKERSEIWAHYEKYKDKDGNLRALFINFSTITSHRGTDIGRAVENCLIEWGLKNILTITVDNASSNDKAIDYLKGKLMKWGDNCILKGKWTHVRFFVHILNLVVQDGVKERGISVDRIRACEKSLVVDVPTRWNSTYLMLSVAMEYERVFDRFAEKDFVCTRDLHEGDGKEFEDDKKEGPPGVPESKDWANVRLLVVFLKHFYDMTLRVSGTKYITSNSYFECINCLDIVLKRCFLTNDNDLKSMSIEMMKKFDKYWGDTKKFNMLVLIASIFYPRTKFKYLKVNLCSMYGTEEGNEDGNEVVTLCRNALKELFNDYKRIYSDQHRKNATSSSHISHNQSSSISVECLDTGVFGVFEDTIETMRKKNMDEVKRRKAESDIAKET
ncbi:zinc finger BED domain-containing protein RICESLEEPER 2-like protein [Tanacetum coccineum]